MEYAKKDLKLSKLQNILKEREEFQKNKLDSILHASIDNPALTTIANEYKHQQKQILDTKQDQIKALQLISTYISNITLNEQLSNNLINHSKKQQKSISKLIKKLNEY